jgi:hypothetical protein
MFINKIISLVTRLYKMFMCHATYNDLFYFPAKVLPRHDRFEARVC